MIEMKLILVTNFKNYVNSIDMTVTQLSSFTKVPIQTFNKSLAGLEPRNMDQVKKIASYFELTIDELAKDLGPASISDA